MTRSPIAVLPISKREALAEQIVRQLVGLIRSGDLKPGDRLPAERALARDLGVGRPTLREALRALQLLGVLDIRHGGGVFVAQLQPDTLLGPLHLFLSLDHPNVDTILEARKVIEGALIGYVADIIDETTISRLDANLAELETLVIQSSNGEFSRDRFNALAEQFRCILEDAIDNPILARAVKSLDILSAATRNRLAAPANALQLLDNHRCMVEALIRHDGEGARRALDAHIDYLCSACNVTLRSRKCVS